MLELLRPRYLVTKTLEPMRRHGRIVLWPPTVQMGIGNILYWWLNAYHLRREGHDAWVLRRSTFDYWVPSFPGLAHSFDLERDEVRFFDQRRLVCPFDFSAYPRETIESFVRDFVLQESAFQGVSPDTHPGRVVMNIRRGDYYSDLKFRGKYAFDIVEFVRVALAAAEKQAPIDSIHIVSDDIEWCRARLGWLSDRAELSFPDPNATPMDNFVELCAARRLVLTNSTFSYWGGIVSNVLHRDNHPEVIAPWFHARHLNHLGPYLLDPKWTIIPDIPGGWDS